MRTPPTIDMRPDGTFSAPPGAPWGMGGRAAAGVPWSTRIMLGTMLVAVAAGAVAIAAFALWLLSLALPVLILAVAAGWLALKWQRWRVGRAGRQGSRAVW